MDSKMKVELCEMYDTKKLKLLIDRLNPDDADQNVLKCQFKELYRLSMRSGKAHTVKCKYKHPTLVGNHGSLYTGIGYQIMKKEYRNYLANSYYEQMDMDNAHPTILNQMLINEGFECDNLQKYVEDRKKYLEMYNVGKKDVLSMINQSYIDNSNPCQKVDFFREIWKKLYKEFIPSMKSKKSKLYKLIISKKNSRLIKKNEPITNEDGAFMHYILATSTIKLVQQTVEKLKQMGYSVDTLIHDGILVRKDSKLGSVELKIKELSDNPNYEFPIKWKWVCMDNQSESITELLGQSSQSTAVYEKDIAEMLCEEYVNSFRNTSKGIYVKDVNNIWKNEKNDVEMCIYGWIQNSDLKYGDIDRDYEGENINKFANKFKNFYLQIILIIANKYKQNDEIIVQMNKCVGYIPFVDSIYCLKTRTFIEFEVVPDIYYNMTIGISKQDRGTQKELDELMDLVINPIFNNDEVLIKEFFTYCARALGGHVDKYWLTADGERNSGKGNLIQMFENCFSSFVRSMDANSLVKKNSLESTERDSSWIEPFVNSRLVFSSEFAEASIVDGTKIKKLASGGDTVDFRCAYGKPTSSSITANWISFSQTGIVNIKPVDAYQNMLHFTFPVEFRLPADKTESTAIIKEANPDAKGWALKSISNRNTFIFYVLDHYVDVLPTYDLLLSSSKNFVMTEDAEDYKKQFKENFEFGGELHNVMRVKDVYAFDTGGMGKTKIMITMKNRGSILKKMRIPNCPNCPNPVWVFTNVKLPVKVDQFL